MARLLSNIILKGMGGYPVANSSSIISCSSYHNGKRYFSTDRNENFEGSSLFSDPNDNFEGTSLFLKRLVEQDVKENPGMIYMKGVPEFPYCGFSSLALRLLRLYNVPISARNIFEDPEIIHAIRDHSSWPTFPQIFIKGEFIGGSDIILNMHLNGELKEKLKDIAVSEESK